MTDGPNWEAISAIGQMVGALGVVVSLVFVGLQIRAETRARRNFTLQQEYRAQSEFQRALGLNGDAASIYYRGMRDPSALSELEFVRFSLLTDSLFRGFEATLHYAEEGELDKDIYNGLRFTMEDLLAYPGVRAIWQLRKHQHGKELHDFIESRLGKVQEPRIYEPREQSREPGEKATSTVPRSDSGGDGGKSLS